MEFFDETGNVILAVGDAKEAEHSKIFDVKQGERLIGF